MKKKSLVLAAVLAACATSFAFATPQTTFEKGKAQVDLGVWNVKASTNTDSSYNYLGNIFFHNGKTEVSTDSKWNFQGGLTYGLNNKSALEYHYYSMKTKVADVDVDGNEHEVNYLYTLNPNVAAYAGWNRIHSSDFDFTNNVAQLGVIAKTQLADKIDVYGKAAIGSMKTSLWEAGLGYQINKDWDVNAAYRSLNTRRDSDNNVTYKGFIAGLAYRFGGPKEDTVAASTVSSEPVTVEQTGPATPTVTETTTPAVAAPAHVYNDYFIGAVHFANDSDTPLPASQTVLDSFVKAAKDNPSVAFKLVGNTDSNGNAAYNQDLSRRRVTNVANYAIDQGIQASQLQASYRGESTPTSSNASDQGRADNRRVDIWMHK